MFPNFSKTRAVLLACRLILGGIFLYAGAIKASSSGQFTVALLPFTFVPATWIGPLAFFLPLVEIAGAILILIPQAHRYGAALLLALCAVFIAALGWALANDLIIACSCFGRDDTPSRGAMIFAFGRDVVLAAMALAIVILKDTGAPEAGRAPKDDL